MSEHHWIKSAIKHHGIFREAAQRAGMSTEAFAEKHKDSPGAMGKRARLALALMHMHNHESYGQASSHRTTIGTNAGED